MKKTERYWIVRYEELDMMLGLLKEQKEFQEFQKGAAINGLLLAADKALAEFTQTNRPAPATMPVAPRQAPRKPVPKREVIEPEPEDEAADEPEPEDMDSLTDEDF
jgi:hypothetical protein